MTEVVKSHIATSGHADRSGQRLRHRSLMVARIWYNANRAAAAKVGKPLPSIGDVQRCYNLTRWEALYVAGHELVRWWP